MRQIRSQETINKRCELLESYGFSILHNDVRVIVHPDIDPIDFSAISEEMFIQYAILKVLKQAKEIGANDIKERLKNLLSV